MIWTIIQARTGSHRLPGKVLMHIGDKTLIQRVVESSEQIGYPVCVAIPVGDNRLALECLERGWSYVEGPEDDLLDRYVMAARAMHADHIIRVCADSPFIDPWAARQTVRHHLDTGADYTTFHLAEGRGVEVFTRHCLERSQVEAPRDIVRYREHIDEWVLANQNKFRCEWVKFSVDTLEDLELARKRAKED